LRRALTTYLFHPGKSAQAAKSCSGGHRIFLSARFIYKALQNSLILYNSIGVSDGKALLLRVPEYLLILLKFISLNPLQRK
jgi:hypothetical protein